MTVLDVLQSTTAYFKKRDVESPRLNAEHLLAHALGLKRIELYLEFERALTEAELAPLRELVRRRGQGEPLQHLLGTVEFCGRTFICDKRALIPRPETEELVEQLLKLEWPRDSRILDVGTGSGVIAISLAGELPHAHVDAIDASEDALSLARENAARLLPDRAIEFKQSDLMLYVSHVYDLIVANLPYVPAGERGSVSREVLRDPEAAVFAGPAGDEVIRRLITDAPPRLNPGGMLALEIGTSQADALAAFLGEQGYHDVSARQDYAGVTRFLFARYG
ncbi:MAG: Peptide chain release factor N(5)-glutamine methyltransferase [uncultured Chthoniobacterales bacterium]|uniref:Release factor glutamine methyltransferase n=1 Tax=uncultured Chthoniobacterales bacterium TaxID=1836801 RepID=A0A6J4IIR4_9BACT|nr:MAG: Peptide chain release factor N(5)-glutamine methyltransferase [uncultured Chthoniobacterales bacterium]